MTGWGRFTAAGGPDIERALGRVAQSIGDAARETLPASHYRALLLIGGYGRGEGGVDRRSGRERPHNNLDLLLVTRGLGRGGDVLKRRLQPRLTPIAADAGVGIDVGVIGEHRLRLAPRRILWYDARFGHKVLAGDAKFLSDLRRFSADRILPSDARDLLVNRGTLLLLNELVLAHAAGVPDRPTLVRHAVKALIGYGDALLFFLGQYHWSYVEKRRRLLAAPGVPARLGQLYAQASAFRLEPADGVFDEVANPSWLDGVRPELEAVHLACESQRLGASVLDWDAYVPLMLREAAGRTLRRPLDLARAVRRALRGEAGPRLSAGVNALLRLATPRDRLAVAFPVVAYRLAQPHLRTVAAAAVSAPDTSHIAVRNAYLRLWGQASDINFDAALERLGIADGPAREAA